MDKLYYMDTKYGCGGVIVNDTGYIVETCPLYRWMLRKSLEEVLRGLRRSNKLYRCALTGESKNA